MTAGSESQWLHPAGACAAALFDCPRDEELYWRSASCLDGAAVALK